MSLAEEIRADNIARNNLYLQSLFPERNILSNEKDASLVKSIDNKSAFFISTEKLDDIRERLVKKYLHRNSEVMFLLNFLRKVKDKRNLL